jgi:hypothetical protein
MYEPDRIFTSGDFLVALLAIYVATTLAGIAAGLLPSGLFAALGSLAIAIALLLVFAAGTIRGRRIPVPVYFLAVVAFPVVLGILLVGLLYLLPSPSLEWTSMLIWDLLAAVNVGFQIRGGPDASLASYFPFWAANMLIVGIGAIAARGVLALLRTG